MKTGSCYWRFKGEKSWRYGYWTYEDKGLYRMGLYNGDNFGGYLVDPREIEVRD